VRALKTPERKLRWLLNLRGQRTSWRKLRILTEDKMYQANDYYLFAYISKKPSLN